MHLGEAAAVCMRLAVPPTLLSIRTTRRTYKDPSAQGAPLTDWIRMSGGLSQALAFF